MIGVFLYGALILITFIIVRVAYILKSRKYVSTKKIETCKLMAIFGSGGHTSEMLQLLGSMSEKYTPHIYILADTDRRSLNKIEEMNFKDYELVRIKRSREVGQSWLSTVFSTFIASFHAIFIVLKYQPDLVLCNGPGTCIPVCGASFLLKVLFFMQTRIVFVESICRVNTLSLSGKILYYFADRLIVQWPELRKRYPNAEYIGRLI